MKTTFEQKIKNFESEKEEIDSYILSRIQKNGVYDTKSEKDVDVELELKFDYYHTEEYSVTFLKEYFGKDFDPSVDDDENYIYTDKIVLTKHFFEDNFDFAEMIEFQNDDMSRHNICVYLYYQNGEYIGRIG